MIILNSEGAIKIKLSSDSFSQVPHVITQQCIWVFLHKNSHLPSKTNQSFKMLPFRLNFRAAVPFYLITLLGISFLIPDSVKIRLRSTWVVIKDKTKHNPERWESSCFTVQILPGAGPGCPLVGYDNVWSAFSLFSPGWVWFIAYACGDSNQTGLIVSLQPPNLNLILGIMPVLVCVETPR